MMGSHDELSDSNYIKLYDIIIRLSLYISNAMVSYLDANS